MMWAIEKSLPGVEGAGVSNVNVITHLLWSTETPEIRFLHRNLEIEFVCLKPPACLWATLDCGKDRWTA
jgi:hypothetical protein